MRTSTRLKGGALLAGLALCGGLLLPATANAAPADTVKNDPVTLQSGHIDAFNLVLDSANKPVLTLKEDVTGHGILRTPESVTMLVTSQAHMSGVDPKYLPTGVTQPFAWLPLSQYDNAIWPGWDSMSLRPTYSNDAKVDINIKKVEGPGKIFIWTQTLWDPVKSLLKNGGYELPGTINQSYLAHVHTNWAFTTPGTYKLTVQADVKEDDGSKQAQTREAVYTIVVAPVPTDVNITGAENPVRAGENVTLTANVTPAAATVISYKWQTRATATDPWSAVPAEKGKTLTVPAVDGAQYKVGFFTSREFKNNSVDNEIDIESSPVTIDTKQRLAITGLQTSYQSGQTITASATATPTVSEARYTWQLQRKDQSTPQTISGQTSATVKLTAEQALNGARLSAKIADKDGTHLADADSVTVKVDDAGATPPQKLEITGLAAKYNAGDTITLNTSLNPASVLNRYEWYIQKNGETVASKIPAENSASYSLQATEQLDKAQISAKLTYTDGEEYVAAAPVTLKIENPNPKPAAAPTAKDKTSVTGEAKGITLSKSKAKAGETVTVEVEGGATHQGEWVAPWMFSTPTLLGGDWAKLDATGKLQLTLPATATTGNHRIALFDTAGSLIGWQPLQIVAAASGSTSPGTTNPATNTGAGSNHNNNNVTVGAGTTNQPRETGKHLASTGQTGNSAAPLYATLLLLSGAGALSAAALRRSRA